MEFALHNSLPIYAGGLGILAGDMCKEASDLGLPLIGIGFMYPQGYFHQHISADGWQQEIYQHLDFSEAPISQILRPDGNRTIAQVTLAGRVLSIAVWLVRAGQVNIYLLDTNVEANSPDDRQLSARLYIAEPEIRIQQEIILGIGGVRILRALGINPATSGMLTKAIRPSWPWKGPVKRWPEGSLLNSLCTKCGKQLSLLLTRRYPMVMTPFPPI
jgi:starch phosphorylase